LSDTNTPPGLKTTIHKHYYSQSSITRIKLAEILNMAMKRPCASLSI
jgi:hypothetical protein